LSLADALHQTVKPMRAPVFSAAVAAAMLTVARALAEPATPEGAQELSQTAAAYFGKAAVEHGVIAITPQGESYLATIDLHAAIDTYRLPPDVQLSGRWQIVLTPMADGAWNVSASDFPTNFMQRDVEKVTRSASISAAGFHFEGVFDPKLAAFVISKGNADSFDIKMRVDDHAASEPGELDFHYGAVRGSTTAVAAANGGVTIALQERIDGLRKSTSGPMAMTGPLGHDLAETYELGPVGGEGSIEGLRAAALADLWRFLVAHAGHNDANPAAFQSDVKTRIIAALPLWDKLATTANLRDATLQMDEAKVAMNNITETVTMSGLNAQGSLGLGFKVDDLGVRSPLIPAWAAPLTPTAVDLDLTLSAGGIDKIVRLAIDNFDAASTPPLSAETGVKMKAMLMSGDPKLTIAHGHFTSPGLDLDVQGALALTPPTPSGKVQIAVDSLDKLLAIVGNAAESDPGMQEAVLGLTLMKGLAKTDENGKLNWEIALGADGAVSVNGMAMPKTK
jgi:hypothetical protein